MRLIFNVIIVLFILAFFHLVGAFAASDNSDSTIQPNQGVMITNPYYATTACKNTLGSHPTQYNVTVYLTNIWKVDLQSGTFDADFWYIVKSQDVDFTAGHLPPVGFSNGIIKDYSQEYVDKHYYEVNVYGTFFTNMDFHQYPFEKLTLPIVVEPLTPCYTNTTVFVPDSSSFGVDPKATVSGWNISEEKQIVTEYLYPGVSSGFARYVATFETSHPSMNSFIKTIMPVTLITGLSLLIFWIPENFTPRIYLTAPLLLALVALHVNTLKDLPSLSYLTIFDKVMVIDYALFANAIVSLAIQMRLHKNHGDDVIVKKANRIGRFMIPAIIAVLGFILFAINNN